MMKAQKNDTGITKNRTVRPDRSKEAKKINKEADTQPIKMSKPLPSRTIERFTKGQEVTTYKPRQIPARKTTQFTKPPAKAKAKPKPKPKSASSSSSAPATTKRVTVRTGPGTTQQVQISHAGKKAVGAPRSSSGAAGSSTFGEPGALKKAMQKLQSGQL